MQLMTVEFSTLLAPKDNPRRSLDATLIAGLAQSIRTDGVLQNLIVRPEGNGRYRIVSGKRRYLALKYLKKEGAIDDAYPVPVEIMEELGEADGVRIAAVENLQREPLDPMDEADAIAKLLQGGSTIDDITGKTGLSAKTVKRRVAIANLCGEAKKALRNGVITVAVAEALTLGSREQQRSMMESLASEEGPDAADIREMFIEQKPSVAMAVFPCDRYEGPLTTDLFSDEETTYFADVDQFLRLQREAVEALAEVRRKTAAFVDLHHSYSVPLWQYEEAKEGDASGVVIHFHPSGRVEVHEGLIKHPVEEHVAQATSETPVAPRAVRERPEFNAQLLRYVALQKSAAVQAALLGNPRKARELASTLLLLGLRLDYGLRLSVHPCLSMTAEERGTHRAHQVVEGAAAEAVKRLRLEERDDLSSGVGALRSAHGAHPLHEAVGQLPDDELDQLLVLLPVLCFGQEATDRLDTGASLFNAVAASLDLNMRDWWTPDVTFLSALRRDQVLAVAAESGALDRLQGLPDQSKKEAIEALSHHFASAASPDDSGSEELQKARKWLPGVFRFPAVPSLSSASSAPTED